MATIGEIVETLGLVIKNIGMLYDKIDNLTKRVEELELARSMESHNDNCSYCGRSGFVIEYDRDNNHYYSIRCSHCHGTGKIKVKEN